MGTNAKIEFLELVNLSNENAGLSQCHMADSPDPMPSFETGSAHSFGCKSVCSDACVENDPKFLEGSKHCATRSLHADPLKTEPQGVDIAAIPWEFNVNVQLDVQLGRSPTEWQTNLFEVKRESQDPWLTSISEISRHRKSGNEWRTAISGDMVNEDVPANWRTQLKDIGERSSLKSDWSSRIADIAPCSSNGHDWAASLSAPEKLSSTKWSFKFPASLKILRQLSDWKFYFHKTAAADDSKATWETRLGDLSVESAEKDWSTVISEMEERVSGPDLWPTAIYELNVPKTPAEDWSTDIKPPPEVHSGHCDWSVQFVDIAENSDEKQNWSFFTEKPVAVAPVPAPWETSLRDIMPVADTERTSWSTSFSSIQPRHEAEKDELWSTTFMEPVTEANSNENTWLVHINDLEVDSERYRRWRTIDKPVQGIAKPQS